MTADGRDGWAGLAADLGGALRFFSRVPVPPLSPSDDPAAPTRFERAARAVPFAGAVLAMPAALLAAVLAHTDLPPMAAGALLVALSALVTGALHEDGLADTADGLGGAYTRERRLEIMKDSRIGVFGGAALALGLTARAALAGALLAAGSWAAGLALLAAGALSRAAMVAVWTALPPARTGGLSVGAGRPGGPALALALVSGGLIALLALPAGGPVGVALGLVLAALAALALAAAARRLIGGQTGDILGAVQQVAEIAFLVGILA